MLLFTLSPTRRSPPPYPPAAPYWSLTVTALTSVACASSATLVDECARYSGRIAQPLVRRRENAAVASDNRHELALKLKRREMTCDMFATTSFTARAKASLPPGACVTRTLALFRESVRLSSVAQPVPLPPTNRRRATSP